MNISHSVENEYLRRHPVDAAEQLETIRDPELEPVVGSLDPRALYRHGVPEPSQGD